MTDQLIISKFKSFNFTQRVIEINFNKQVHKGRSTNNSVVIVMPDKESVAKLVGVLKERLDI